jgi:hypothetical protein
MAYIEESAFEESTFYLFKDSLKTFLSFLNLSFLKNE